MKFKKLFFVLLVIISLINPLILSSFSSGHPYPATEDIEWGFKEGSKYTWVVKQTNETLGFLPVNSRYELTINSITSVPINASILNVTLTKYNSTDHSTTVILDDQPFIYFNASSEIVIFYSPFYIEHGFVVPNNYIFNFQRGVFDFFDDTNLFSAAGADFDIYDKLLYFKAWLKSPYLYILWSFKGDYITLELTIKDKSDEIQYVLALEGVPIPISFGNFFLIYFGLMFLGLIYVIYKKKIQEFN